MKGVISFNNMEKTVVELFAGVGGFRIAFNNVTLKRDRTVENGDFNFVWENQWEPSTRIQHAYFCYSTRFNTGYVNDENKDICTVNKKKIPNHNILVGGFPCQDYSVARSLSNEKGIEGKKGVLWWQIVDIIKVKKPRIILLENVDRLIKSPSTQRGRDFGIMLKCLDDLGYLVEWRVINAADYGFAQRRRRIYIFAIKKTTKYYKKQIKKDHKQLIETDGIFAKAFPLISTFNNSETSLSDYKDLVEVSNEFKFKFHNSGVMSNGKISTFDYLPKSEEPIALGKLLEKNVDERLFLNEKQIAKFAYLRGNKKVPRVKPDGTPYLYSEGAMSPYDSLKLPGRTMLTSEGTTNRSTHIIQDPKTKKMRFLSPVECERLNGFPDNWTNTGMPFKKRYFMMGNALVVGVIRRISNIISQICEEED